MFSSASRFLSIVLLGLVVVALVPAQQAKTPPTKEQIAEWIKGLAADDFDKREEASKLLWEAGQPAEAALVEAAKSTDEEVRRRANEILEKFKLGIYPDTPKKVADLILRYQNADPNTRTAVIRELFEAGTPGCRALMKLLSSEQNAEAKSALMQVVSSEVNRAVPALLAEGNFETLEQFLDLGLAGDVKTGAPNYGAYYLLRGKLDAALDKVKNRKDLDAKRQQEILAYLYRARGDLKAARAAAEKAEQPELTDELLFEMGDWKELAKRLQLEELVDRLNGPGKSIEKLGYAAAYHRLAGNKKDYDARIAAIVKFAADAQANDKAVAAFSAAKALFLNDKPDEAMKVLKDGGRSDVVFEILCVQARFAEAFELLEQTRKNGDTGLTAQRIEILAARTLYLLGEKDKAKPMFAKLAAAVQGNDLSWFEELVDAECRCRLFDDAFALTGQILDASKDDGWPPRLFPKLFPGRGDLAVTWYMHLRTGEEKGQVTASEHLKKVRTLLEGKTPAKDVEKLLADGEAATQERNVPERDRSIVALVEIAMQYKMETAALAGLEKAKTPKAMQRLGDVYAEKKQWDKAAQQYKAVWDTDKHQPLPLYLYGQALAKSGKEAEGKKLMEQAHWLPLGDEEGRHLFASALEQRGQMEAARRENDLLSRTSHPASYFAGEALRRTALDALSKKDYLKAAEGHEMAMLRCLRPYVNFVQMGAYVGVPAHVHRLRARGLLDAGKLEESQREIAAAQALLPGDVDLAVLIVPLMVKRGHAKEATEVFDRSLAVQEKMCKDYPKSSSAHNSWAWLSVCCGRNLEEAKTHALKAVELDPKVAGHHDTLAEVYFQLGDKDKAVATQKKAIELDPKKKYFREQLKRLEAGDPKADRPPEIDDED